MFKLHFHMHYILYFNSSKKIDLSSKIKLNTIILFKEKKKKKKNVKHEDTRSKTARRGSISNFPRYTSLVYILGRAERA